MSPNRIACVFICGAFLAGCGGPREIAGGTAGLLHTDGQPLSDVLVSVYRDGDSDFKPLGIAITDSDGRFNLRTREPAAPLSLDSGTYRFTVESVGEVYLIWPSEFADRVKTPLKQSISSHDEEVAIHVPRPRVIH